MTLLEGGVEAFRPGASTPFTYLFQFPNQKRWVRKPRVLPGHGCDRRIDEHEGLCCG